MRLRFELGSFKIEWFTEEVTRLVRVEKIGDACFEIGTPGHAAAVQRQRAELAELEAARAAEIAEARHGSARLRADVDRLQARIDINQERGNALAKN